MVGWIVRLFCLLSAFAVQSNAIHLSNLTRPVVIPIHRHYKFLPHGRNEFPIFNYIKDQYQKIHRKFLGDPIDPVVDITGCASADFVVQVTTSGITQSLTVDTGSASMAVAGNDCKNCGVSPLYTPGGNAKNTGIDAQSYYVDGSGFDGTVYIDNVTLGDIPSINMSFVSIYTQSGFFTTDTCFGYLQKDMTQGIIGFAYESELVPGTDLYFGKLVEERNVPDIFALQMCRTTGRLWLGGYNSTFFSGSLAWTPVIDESYYVVNLTDISVEGNSVGVSPDQYLLNGGPAVDSGTSLIILPQAAYDAIVRYVKNDYFISNFGSDFFDSGECAYPKNGASSSELNANLLSITFVLQDLNLTMLPVNSYLFEAETGLVDPPYYYCPGIQGSNQTILGWPFMTQYTVVFDRVNSRVGFAPTLYCNAQWEGEYMPCSEGQTQLYPNATCTDSSTGAPVPEEYCLTPVDTTYDCGEGFMTASFASWKLVLVVLLQVLAIQVYGF